MRAAGGGGGGGGGGARKQDVRFVHIFILSEAQNKVFGSTAEARRQKVKRQLTEKRRHEIEESLQLLGERSLVIVPDSVVQGRVDDDAQLTDQLKQNKTKQ